jgi:hypothetical protein
MYRSDASSLRSQLGQLAAGTPQRRSQTEIWKEVAPLDRGAVHEWLGVLGAGVASASDVSNGLMSRAERSPPAWPRLGALGGSAVAMPVAEPAPVLAPVSAPVLAPESAIVRTRARHRPSAWAPPLAVLIDVARSAAHAASGAAVWIGDRVCPYGRALAEPAPIACLREAQQAHHSRDLLARSVFVRAASAADRLWSCEVALRSGAACAVIADGSGFDLAATRRLQLAAEAGGTPCLLARPDRELSVRSAAMTRWVVRWAASEHAARRWSVELVRCKGLRRASELGRPLILEQDHATGAVRLVADVLDRSGHAAARDDAARRTG